MFIIGSAREPSSDEVPVWAIVVITLLGFACVSLIIFVVILLIIMTMSGRKDVNTQTRAHFKSEYHIYVWMHLQLERFSFFLSS